MENEIILKVEGDYDDSILASTSQEVLVEVRGTPPPSHEGHVVIASAPHSSQDCTVNEFKLVDEDFTISYIQPNTQDSINIDLDDFMDIVTIKCRSCNFFCSTKSQLADHVRASHTSAKDVSTLRGENISEDVNYNDDSVASSVGYNVNVSEEQRQLISSLLALANENPTKASKSSEFEPGSKTDSEIRSPHATSSVYLCGECSLAFTSIVTCNDHVVQVHQKLKQRSDSNEILASLVQQNDVKTQSLFISSISSSEVVSGAVLSKKKSPTSNFKIRRKLLPKLDANDVDAEETLKRPRKPTSKFDDFVVEKSAKMSSFSVRKSREEVRCLVKGCNYVFSKDKLSIHMSCHVNGTEGQESKIVFKCPECPTNFENWRNCAMHLWKSHQIDLDLLTCPECKTFKTIIPARLDIHLLTHSDHRSFGCSVCKKKFKQLSQLKNHSVIHMDKEKDVVPLWYTKKLCNLCNKYFSDSKCLKKHVQAVHSKLKPYICQVCNHQSARKAMLEMHMRQHTGEKPYSCDICDYRTGDHNSLRRHKMRHSGQKPYRCPFCPYASIQSAAYKNHVQVKHSKESSIDANVYICGECTFKAVTIDAYIAHQRSHFQQSRDEDVVNDEESDKSLDSNQPPSFDGDDHHDEERDHLKSKTFSTPTTKFRGKKIGAKNRKISRPVTEEEDSLHATTTDLGGTTIVELC